MNKSNEDITDDEIEKFIIPFENNFSKFMISYIIPEVFAFQLANSYFRECLCNASLEQHYHTMCDVFNGFQNSLNQVKDSTIQLLEIKYNLTIKKDMPLELKKYQ